MIHSRTNGRPQLSPEIHLWMTPMGFTLGIGLGALQTSTATRSEVPNANEALACGPTPRHDPQVCLLPPSAYRGLGGPAIVCAHAETPETS